MPTDPSATTDDEDTPADLGPWASSIVEFDPAVDPEQLLAHPLNARRHPGEQRDALRESLDRAGWVDVVKVNTRTGHVVDGHARVEEAITAGAKVPVLWVDLDEDTERFVLATLDPISAMATYDAEVMSMLTDGLAIESQGLIDMLGDVVVDKTLGLGPVTDGPAPATDDDTTYSGDGTLLDRVGAFVAEPVHDTQPGDVWDLWGRHTLVVADVHTGHPLWRGLLTDEHAFLPYPGPYVIVTNLADRAPLLMVQPDTYIAAKILDAATACYPDRPAPTVTRAADTEDDQE